jgi:hypothetical protein
MLIRWGACYGSDFQLAVRAYRWNAQKCLSVAQWHRSQTGDEHHAAKIIGQKWRPGAPQSAIVIS